MGTYINRGNSEFRDIVARCRRFGKSMAARMLCAYYDKSCDSRELFRGLKAEQDKSFETYLNKYYVICVDMTDFTTRFRNEKEIVNIIQNKIINDVLLEFPQIIKQEDDDLMEILSRISQNTGERFVMIIDEWDAILREMGTNDYIVTAYVDLLRRLFKGSNSNILSYNDENSLACVLTVAYIWARNEYVIHREYATGKGYADLVMIPRRNVSKPALVIELKFNNSVDTAIDQIKRKEYPAKIAEYSGNILLVGINYDRETKKHTCRIEKGITSANNPNVFSFAVEG